MLTNYDSIATRTSAIIYLFVARSHSEGRQGINTWLKPLLCTTHKSAAHCRPADVPYQCMFDIVYYGMCNALRLMLNNLRCCVTHQSSCPQRGCLHLCPAPVSNQQHYPGNTCSSRVMQQQHEGFIKMIPLVLASTLKHWRYKWTVNPQTLHTCPGCSAYQSSVTATTISLKARCQQQL